MKILLVCITIPRKKGSLYTAHGGQGTPSRSKGKKTPSSRKDARKRERLDRKKRKADHFSASKRKTEEEHVDVPGSKRRKTVHFADEVRRSNPPLSKESHEAWARGPPELSNARKPKPTALEKLISHSTRKAPGFASRIPRTREEAEEDAYITYLEAKLGYSSGNKRKKGDEDDGLDGGYMRLECVIRTC